MSDDAPRAPKRSLPVTWKGGAGVAPIHDRAPVIQEASDSDVAIFADQRATTCGSCKHFRPPEKDRPAVRGMIAAAIHEAKWKLGFLTHAPEDIGRCRENDTLAVGMHSKSCDHYSGGRGGFR